MALISCPECNHNVSDKAAVCPNCGYPLIDTIPSSTKASIKCGETLENNRSNEDEINRNINDIITNGLKGCEYDALRTISILLKIFGFILAILIVILFVISRNLLFQNNQHQVSFSLIVGFIVSFIPYLITNSAANKIDLMIALENNSRRISASLDAVVYLLKKRILD
jgi:hypothetical protein